MGRGSRRCAVVVVALGCVGGAWATPVIIATGQNNGDPTHVTGNHVYSINVLTGAATPISPVISSSLPAGLAGLPDGRILGFQSGQIGEFNPLTGGFSPIGGPTGLSLTGFEVLAGAGFGVPTSGADRRLQRIDLASGAATGLGTGNPIGEALDAFFGTTPGTNAPFIIGMGAVGSTLYGVHTATGRNNLVALDPSSGGASVIGAINAVGTSGPAGGGVYSGFSAMTGVDTDGDGVFDALFGNANFVDPDGPGPLPSQRAGAVVRYTLSTGTWELVGSNPGLIFFGFASAPGAGCYANCDGSTATPALSPADFVCFLNKYRAGEAYANCDGSTGTPALTPADFVCFLNKYRAGCP